MATEPSPQRAYRAACPNCGAPVEFRSAASAFAVCSFCRSSVVREGDALRRIGQSAELFDDHSTLQLGASGTYLGQAFTLVGRLQYGTGDGSWNEWFALFDAVDVEAAKPAWLSEDNGRYVLVFDAPLAASTAPPATALVVGSPVQIAGQSWSVASVVSAKLLAAEGELPVPPVTGREFAIADFRNPQGEVATLDYRDPAAPRWSVGRSIALSELAMRGLAEPSEKTLDGRSLECPNCGSSLQVKLESTKAIVCDNCKAVVDVSAGVGGDLQHYVQTNSPHGALPRIPLGSSGNFVFDGTRPLPWQVVGYAERFELPDDPDDEQTFWREYLLYNRGAGFAFLVDAEDGWSWVVPITGAPEAAGGGGMRYRNVSYRKLFDYKAQVSYVLGEFYWRVERDQQTFNTDYAGTGAKTSKRLNREQSDSGQSKEVVWSAGQTMAAADVIKGFGLTGPAQSAIKRDSGPLAVNASGLLAKGFFIVFIVVLLLSMFRCGSDDNCDDLRSTYGESSREYQNCVVGSRSRTGGGAFGGFSSGGFHK